jgi:hypothetical protein
MSTVYKSLATTIIAILVITAFILVQPIQTWAQQPQFPTLTGCTLGLVQPTDAIDMNTVVSKTAVKTVHVEKEIFRCEIPNIPGLTIVDVSIYTEIIEDLSAFPTVKSNTAFEVITCVKNDNGNVIACKNTIPSTAEPALSCKPSTVAFPIEMNTIVASNGIVKTVEAQKEVFKCPMDIPKAFKDVTIFTEVFENMVGQPTQNIIKLFEVTTCVKDKFTANVTACTASKPAKL